MNKMTLKDFMEMTFDKNPINAMSTARDLIELESIEQKLNLFWGIELEIMVKPMKRMEGKWYGKSLINSIINNK